jgi:hypothetical protein
MRLVADSGLWSTGRQTAPTPLVAVLEVSGAVLSWAVDDTAAVAKITFTDPARADWLWRVLGEPGHIALAAALDGRTPDAAIELTGVDLRPESLEPLRRLALGHWLRRWWPASQRDGIAVLDGALLDAEIAVLTARAEDFFTDDTFDSDVAALLRPHAEALSAHLQGGDPRVVELVRTCAGLADDVGVAFGGAGALTLRRDDYALAAGQDSGGADPAGSRQETPRSTGVPSRPASSTPPRTPSNGASKRPMVSRKPLCTLSCQDPDWPQGSLYGCGPARSAVRACSTPTAKRRSRSLTRNDSQSRNRLHGTMIGVPPW